MRSYLWLVPTVAFLLVAQVGWGADPKLLGTWVVESAKKGDKADDINLGKQYTFTADKMTFKTKDGLGTGEFSYSAMVLTKTPNIIRIERKKGWIYKIDKDTLTICLRSDSEDPPTEFPDKPGPNIMFWVLKRQ